MKWLAKMFLLALLGARVAATQPATPKVSPTPPNQSRVHGNVVDWSLKRINPHDIDYGLRIEEFRQEVIDRTIHDYDFWAHFVAGGALGMMFLMVLWQDRKNRRMTFSTARIVTAYHNQLAMARDQIALLSSEYAQAKRILDEQTEASYVSRPQTAKRESTPSSSNNNEDTASAVPAGQPSREQLLAENGSLKHQVNILRTKWQEEQQQNRTLKGE